MDGILMLTIEHVALSVMGVGLALLIGVPLAILITRNQTLANFTMAVVDVLQTIPSLALLAALMIYLGLGNKTLIVTLMIYSLLPVVRNTYIGLTSIDRELIESGRGMGMTRWQLLRMVELPIALPVMLAGVRWLWLQPLVLQTIGAMVGGGDWVPLFGGACRLWIMP